MPTPARPHMCVYAPCCVCVYAELLFVVCVKVGLKSLITKEEEERAENAFYCIFLRVYEYQKQDIQ